jgi:CheY-like chemotaxis protein/MinD-like ATPase involved in chromosome partitioning or flagellar assembly
MEEKILIVDDEFDTLRLVGLMLERQGYRIIAAENGTQALETLKREKPDLVLLDVMMPDLDGFEVAKRIRADSEFGNTPIIMFTAKTQVEDKVTGLESGADVYLTKPTQPRELFAQVKVLLARAKKSPTTPLPRGEPRGHMIGVIAAKGGLGVSSLVLNLGITIRRITEQDVLVADFDPGRGDISWELGYHAQGGISELLDSSASAITPEVIAPLVVLHDSGVHLLLASQSPKQAIEIMQAEKIKAIASQLPFLVQWVVMDLGSHLMPATQSLARLCDDLIIVVAPNPVNIRQTKALIDDLITLGIGEARIRSVLINRVRSAIQLNWEQVENDLGYKISTVFTPAPELAFQASVAHTPMVIQQPNNITAQQFDNLATIITKRVIQ